MRFCARGAGSTSCSLRRDLKAGRILKNEKPVRFTVKTAAEGSAIAPEAAMIEKSSWREFVMEAPTRQ
jgi:hypothetical protein